MECKFRSSESATQRQLCAVLCSAGVGLGLGLAVAVAGLGLWLWLGSAGRPGRVRARNRRAPRNAAQHVWRWSGERQGARARARSRRCEVAPLSLAPLWRRWHVWRAHPWPAVPDRGRRGPVIPPRLPGHLPYLCKGAGGDERGEGGADEEAAESLDPAALSAALRSLPALAARMAAAAAAGSNATAPDSPGDPDQVSFIGLVYAPYSSAGEQRLLADTDDPSTQVHLTDKRAGLHKLQRAWCRANLPRPSEGRGGGPIGAAWGAVRRVFGMARGQGGRAAAVDSNAEVAAPDAAAEGRQLLFTSPEDAQGMLDTLDLERRRRQCRRRGAKGAAARRQEAQQAEGAAASGSDGADAGMGAGAGQASNVVEELLEEENDDDGNVGGIALRDAVDLFLGSRIPGGDGARREPPCALVPSREDLRAARALLKGKEGGSAGSEPFMGVPVFSVEGMHIGLGDATPPPQRRKRKMLPAPSTSTTQEATTGSMRASPEEQPGSVSLSSGEDPADPPLLPPSRVPAPPADADDDSLVMETEVTVEEVDGSEGLAFVTEGARDSMPPWRTPYFVSRRQLDKFVQFSVKVNATAALERRRAQRRARDRARSGSRDGGGSGGGGERGGGLGGARPSAPSMGDGEDEDGLDDLEPPDVDEFLAELGESKDDSLGGLGAGAAALPPGAGNVGAALRAGVDEVADATDRMMLATPWGRRAMGVMPPEVRVEDFGEVLRRCERASNARRRLRREAEAAKQNDEAAHAAVPPKSNSARSQLPDVPRSKAPAAPKEGDFELCVFIADL